MAPVGNCLGLVAFLLVAGGSLVAEAAAPRCIPLVDFSKGEDARQVYAVDFGNHRQGLRYDSARGCVVYSFTNLYSHLVFPVANSRLRERLHELNPRGFYVKYRAPRYEATTEFKMEAGKGIYVAMLPVAPGPDYGLAVVRGKHLSWSRGNLPYVATNINTVYIAPTGSGVLEVYEMGVYQEDARPALPRRDATPVPADAFAVFPEPRQWRLTGGTFHLPANCSWRADQLPIGAREAFRRELAAFHGVTLQEATTDRVAQVEFSLRRNLAPIRYDGFSIEATPTGIVACALEPTGLAYAADVLRELIWRAGGRDLPTFQLKDWPRYRYRPWMDMTSSFGHLQKYPVGFYTEALERFVLSRRYNRIGHCMDTLFQWSSPHMPKQPNAWTHADYAGIVDFVNGRGARMMPTIQSLGHQDWFICSGKANACRFGEDGKPGVLCTRNPETTNLLKGMYDELIDICSRNRGYEPDFFLSMHDEARWRTHEVAESNRCARCAGVPKNRLFAESVTRCRDWLAERGLREVVFTDMIAEAHNGRNRYNCAAIVDDLPKDVVLASWSSLDALSIALFQDKGFANWKINTGVRSDSTGDENLEGMGLGVYSFNWWLSHIHGCSTSSYGLMAAALQGYYAWRESPRGDDDLRVLARKWGDFLMRGWSRKPLRGKVREEPLSTSTSANLGKVVSLIFSHSATVDPLRKAAFLSATNTADAILGPEVAACTVHYADGAAERISMTYGWNVGESELDGSRWTDFVARYIGDCRRVTPDSADRRVVYEYEWQNPRPGVEVVRLEFNHSEFPGVVYRLHGLSAGRSYP